MALFYRASTKKIHLISMEFTYLRKFQSENKNKNRYDNTVLYYGDFYSEMRKESIAYPVVKGLIMLMVRWEMFSTNSS